MISQPQLSSNESANSTAEFEALHKRITDICSEIIRQKEDMIKISEKWSGEDLKPKLEEDEKQIDELKRRIEGHKICFHDQRKINDQNWNKIRRIERYLAGKDYMDEQEIQIHQISYQEKEIGNVKGIRKK